MPVYGHVGVLGGIVGCEISVCDVKCALTSSSSPGSCLIMTVSFTPIVSRGYHGVHI